MSADEVVAVPETRSQSAAVTRAPFLPPNCVTEHDESMFRAGVAYGKAAALRAIAVTIPPGGERRRLEREARRLWPNGPGQPVAPSSGGGTP